MALKERLQSDMKDALRAKDKARLGVIRLMLAAIKQREVDERTELDDAAVLAVLEKQLKQRGESIRQYRDAGRDDLAAKEEAEVAVIKPYLPEPLSTTELEALIGELIESTGASSIRDMGKVMGALKAKAAGRVDMGHASKLIKARLGA